MTTEPNIVLTGFMGTGKSSVGRALAHRLSRDFVDTDTIIEERHGPITLIFQDHGEAEFRRFEHQVAAELARRSGLVIATGGRLMLDPANAALFADSTPAARVYCLQASAEEVHRRVTADGPSIRPLLAGGDARHRIGQLLAERAEGYGRFEAIDTEARTIDEVVDAIIEHLSPPPAEARAAPGQ